MALTRFRIPSELEVSGSSYLTGSLNVKGVISGSDAVSASFFTSSQVGAFKGDGSALTNVTSSFIKDGTISQNITLNGSLSASSFISASKFVGSGAELTNLPAPSTITGDYVVKVSTSDANVSLGGTSAAGGGFKGAVTVAVSSNPTFTSLSTTGNVTIGGDLYVNGDTTELKVSELRIEDKLISVASASAYVAGYNDGAGIEFGNQAGAPTFKYNSGSNQLSSSVPLYIKGDITASSYISSSDGFIGDGSRLTNINASNLTVGTDSRGTWNHSTAQTVVSFSTGSYAAGKFAMVFEQKDTGKRQVSEFFVGHSGSTAFITQYNDIYMSADQARLVTLDVASAVGASGVINVTASRDASQSSMVTGSYVVSKLYMVKPV